MSQKYTPVIMTPEERRERIRDAAKQGISGLFPLIGDHRQIELNNLRVDAKDYSANDLKKSILTGRTLAESVKGDVVIKDKSGKVLDTQKNHTLMRLPYFTPQNSMIVKGNEYVMRHQLRTMPGVYTRKRANDELEASFNLSKGANFRVTMDPAKGHLNMEHGVSKVPLYPVLRSMGMSHGDISKRWGAGVADRNQEAFDSDRDKHVDKLYKKLLPSRKRVHTNTSDKVGAIRDVFDNTAMDPDVNKRTLGVGHSKVGPMALLDASKKLLNVYQGKDTGDDRDSLEFQTLHSAEDFIKERLDLSNRHLKYKLKSKLDLTPRPQVKSVLPSATFTKPVSSFITTSQIATTPMQINPVELISDASMVTRFGEGGIASERAIPGDVRTMHSSQLGALDPFRTPESSKAGVDVGAAYVVHKDEKGKLHTILKNAKTGKNEFVSVGSIPNSTVAFSNQEISKGRVDVLKNGKVTKVKPSEVQYQVPHSSTMYGVSTNLIPFLDSTQGNRIVMGSKHVAQAVPLRDREEPLVQVGAPPKSGYSSMEEFVAKRYVLPTAPEEGKVTRVDKDYIHIKGKSGKSHKVVHFNNYPLASKTALHDDVTVKRGDSVKKGTALTNNNFTKNGRLALGTNLDVGYMAYHGLNTNDAVVISETAAEKLASEHLIKKVIDLDSDTVLDGSKHAANFPRSYTKDQYAKLSKGVVTPGTILRAGDPIASVLRKAPPSLENDMFGKIHKSLRKTYSDHSIAWDKGVDGEVVDVERTGNRVAVTIKSTEPMKLGDKVSNRYGGKGVVSKIVPDSDMVQNESGKPLDLLWASTGVISRINPGQILETAAAKVAKKTGKPIVVQNFEKRDNVVWAKDLLKKNGLKDKETVFDPISGKKIPGIMVGPQYTYKLFKNTESNYAARGAGGSYDVNQQPGRGGVEGAKGMGGMMVNALLAYDARDTLKENATVKGTRNSEYWDAVRLGRPIPAARAPFAHDKFVSMLTGAGMRMGRDGNHMSMAPLTDKDILKMSSGEIKNGKMVRAKDLRTEKGGLFDDAVTGGLSGEKWSHIKLPEPVVNPVFKEPVRRLLGYSQKELDNTIATKGGAFIKKQLSDIDPVKRAKELRKNVWGMTPGSSQDNVVKQIKALDALNSNGTNPRDAYILNNFPVLPPKFRPLLPGPRGNLLVADVNHMYRDLSLAGEKLSEAKDLGLPDEDVAMMRGHLQNAVGAVAGLNEPVSDKARLAKKKGLVNTITGTKDGFFNGKMVKKRLDLSGRGTAAPDPSLGINEFGMPEDMGWSLYQPFAIGRLVRNGHSAVRAKELVEAKAPIARQALTSEIATRPVLLNRAPTLHRYNVVAAYPKLIPGKTIKVNPFIEKGMNLDYDGDALQVYVPASHGSVKDAEKMLLSKNLLGDRTRNSLQVFPSQEAIVGLYKGSAGKATNKKQQVFNTRADALAAYRRGEIGVNDPVKINKA